MQEGYATTLLPDGTTRLLRKPTPPVLARTSALLAPEHPFPEHQLITGDPVAGRRGMCNIFGRTSGIFELEEMCLRLYIFWISARLNDS